MSDAIMAVAFFAMCAVVLHPLMKALGRRFDGTDRGDPDLRAEVEGLRARVAELEERVDFSERLLASQRESQPLPGSDR